MRFLTILISLSLLSCDPTPATMNYGDDLCHSCSMTIVDQQHGAQLVTKKGKSYKFDATECMIQSISQFDREDIALYLVTNYKQPATLIDATEATYVISENIPSPMRANVAAVHSIDQAEKLIETHSGKQYNWEQIQSELIKQ